MQEENDRDTRRRVLERQVQVWLTAPAIVHPGQKDRAVPLADCQSLIDEHGKTGFRKSRLGHFNIQPEIVVSEHGIHPMTGIEPGQDGSELEYCLLFPPD